MTDMTPEALRTAILNKLNYAVGKDIAHAHDHDWYIATALAVRDQAVDRWIATTRQIYATGQKRVYYLSLEFLIGRLLSEYLCNLQLIETCRAALSGLNVDLERIKELEPDAALGNGGLGRLAACLMESMASLGIPAFGYGIRYDHGLFRQLLRDGWQEEFAEDWLSFGNPWEFARPEVVYDIQFGGRVEMVAAASGRARPVWRSDETIEAVAYDTPIVGWRGRHVNPLRLWSARAVDPLRLELFNEGDHVGALSEQARLGVLICYEDLMPGPARHSVLKGANVLLNLNNLAVFGRTAALRQHQHLARFRAIESRRWLLRCGTTGSTAVVSATGRVEQQAPPHTAATLVAETPLLDGLTLYTRWGEAFAALCLAAAVLVLGWRTSRGAVR